MRYIDEKKLRDIEEQINDIFQKNACTAADVLYICETIKTTYVINTTIDLVVQKYGLKKVKPFIKIK